MFAPEKHFHRVCVFVLMSVSPTDNHYSNWLFLKKRYLHHHKCCQWRQQPRWSIWCQGQPYRCHRQSQLVYSRKHKHAVGFHLVCSTWWWWWYLLIMLGLERYSCRFLSIIWSFFFLLSPQGCSEMPEPRLDTVYTTLLGQVGLSSPSWVRKIKENNYHKVNNNNNNNNSCLVKFCIYQNFADSTVMPGHDS